MANMIMNNGDERRDQQGKGPAQIKVPAQGRDDERRDQQGKGPEQGEGLDSSVRRERRRRERGEYGRQVSIGRYLATVGSIGWLVVTPTLLGAFVGRWLDQKYQTGITFSGALMILGLVLGCYLAWTVLYTEGSKQ